jgi:hypothetical protein
MFVVLIWNYESRVLLYFHNTVYKVKEFCLFESWVTGHTLIKKKKKIFLIYKGIQNGAVAKSYTYEEGLPNI